MAAIDCKVLGLHGRLAEKFILPLGTYTTPTGIYKTWYSSFLSPLWGLPAYRAWRAWVRDGGGIPLSPPTPKGLPVDMEESKRKVAFWHAKASFCHKCLISYFFQNRFSSTYSWYMNWCIVSLCWKIVFLWNVLYVLQAKSRYANCANRKYVNVT